MHPAGRRTYILIALMALLLLPGTASAQTGTYIAGAGFADVRLFSGTSGRTPLFGEDFSRDATGGGGSVRVGTWVHPRWTLEAGADIATQTSSTFRGPVIAIFPPVPPLEITSTTSFVSVTAIAGFHSPSGRRVRMGYLAGFSFVRATHKTELPFDALPFFTFAEIGSITGGTTGPFTSLSRSSLTVPSGALASKQNSGALTLGIEAAIDLTSKVAIVPELRASTLSGVFLIRPGVGARWNF
jgi:hypothetical protein